MPFADAAHAFALSRKPPDDPFARDVLDRGSYQVRAINVALAPTGGAFAYRLTLEGQFAVNGHAFRFRAPLAFGDVWFGRLDGEVFVLSYCDRTAPGGRDDAGPCDIAYLAAEREGDTLRVPSVAAMRDAMKTAGFVEVTVANEAAFGTALAAWMRARPRAEDGVARPSSRAPAEDTACDAAGAWLIATADASPLPTRAEALAALDAAVAAKPGCDTP